MELLRLARIARYSSANYSQFYHSVKAIWREPQMPGPRIDEILSLMDRTLEGGEHSLLNNTKTVSEGAWDTLLQGAGCSIQEISQHIGLLKSARYLWQVPEC